MKKCYLKVPMDDVVNVAVMDALHDLLDTDTESKPFKRDKCRVRDVDRDTFI